MVLAERSHTELQDIDMYFIRHAESLLNTHPELVNGRSNETPITELGIRQAVHAGHFLVANAINPARIYSSPAIRTRRTAHYCLQAMERDDSEIILDDALQELGQGKWVGRRRADLYDAATLAEVERGGLDFKAPSGESMREVGQRKYDWVGRTFVEPATSSMPEQHLIFGHGVAIRCLAGRILGWDQKRIYETPTANTSLTLITRRAGVLAVGYVGFDPASAQALPAFSSSIA